MGVLPDTLLLVQFNMEETPQDIIIEERNNNSNESIWKQTSMEDQEANNKAKATRCKRIRRRRSNSLMKKRRTRSRSSARIEQRVSTLRNLVPKINNNNNDEDSVGSSLEQLFTQTADYILSLQTRVRLMKTLVDVLSGSSSSSIDE